MQNGNKSKIAFYIGLKNTKKSIIDVDLNIGNPGIGGTQYLFLLTVKKINENSNNHQRAILLTDEKIELNDNDVPYIPVGTEEGAIHYCEKHDVNVLVFNANVADRIDEDNFDTKIRIVLWAHNTLTEKRQIIAARNKSIHKVVCVSEKQYRNMSDTPCWKKCMYINNIITDRFYQKATLSKNDQPIAAYIGSIMPQKGVHNLLKIWKFVEKKEPDAQLYVFGGANIWNQNAKIGTTGVADIYYDKIIRRKLDKLKHPENVHFMGAKGWKELDKLISSVRVGVVNPSYYMRDETFCMSAIEMEAHQIPIVSRQREDGLNTTILHGRTGYLEKKDKDIAKRILELLHSESKSKEMGVCARRFASRFVPENEVYKWNDIVDSVDIYIDCENIKNKESKDSKLLKHDFVLKIVFLLESGKIIDLLKRKLKVKNNYSKY